MYRCTEVVTINYLYSLLSDYLQGLTLGMISTNEDRKVMREDAWKSYLSDPNGKKFANEYWVSYGQ